MANIKQLRVAGVQIIEADGKIDWSKFKNTPATIVSAAGHDHNATHYLSTQTDAMFNTVTATLDNIRAQIEAVGIKNYAYVGGGANNGVSVSKYTRSTETTANLGGLLSYGANGAGITSKIHGYVTSSGNAATKFTYATQSASNISNCPITIGGTLIDHAVQTRGYVTNGSGSWAAIDVLTNSWENRTAATSTSAGRPMLSSYTFGLTKSTGTNNSYKYTYSTGVSATSVSFAVAGNPSGLNKDGNYGYWISNIETNIKHSYVSDSAVQLPLFTVHLSNSNTLSGEFVGFCISGSNHTNVQKITWATETIAAAGSSGVDLTSGSGIEA